MRVQAFHRRLDRVAHTVSAVAVEASEGASLEVLRERLGGDEGYWPVPGRAETAFLSLRRLKDSPPEARFQIEVRITPEEPIRIRRAAALSLIEAAPPRQSEALTFDQLLAVVVPGRNGERQPDGSYRWTPNADSVGEQLAQQFQPPSRARLVRGLGVLVRRGELGRAGTGRRSDPYRYWRYTPAS